MADGELTAIARKTPAWLPLGLVLANLALSGWLLWRAFGPSPYGDPLATSLSAFEKANRLTVFSAQLAPVVASDDERLLGMLTSRQIAVIPARADYTLDLSKVTRQQLSWDEETRRLTVKLPPLSISRPNLDEGRALYLREGIWITRDAQARLTRNNTLLAERIANEQAHNPVLLNLAREAAREAMRQNLAVPLQVAGYGNLTIDVRFDGEQNPP